MKVTAIIAAAALFAAPAFAQEATAPAPQEDAFAAADADGNGVLTLSEVQTIDSTVTQADFDRYDTEGNGVLNRTEFEAWKAAKKVEKADSEG